MQVFNRLPVFSQSNEISCLYLQSAEAPDCDEKPDISLLQTGKMHSRFYQLPMYWFIYGTEAVFNAPGMAHTGR